MNPIITYLRESAPTDNPDGVVVSNRFYPKGLTEKQIYDYYIMNKHNIIKWIDGRQVSFFLEVENSKPVVIRKYKSNPIFLNSENYEKLITGRTLSIYTQMPTISKYFVVDVDGGPGVSFSDVVKASVKAQKLLMGFNVIKYETLFTSSLGVHLIGHTNNHLTPKKTILNLTEMLSAQDEYLVNIKGRKPGSINYDLSPNNEKALHLCRYSLTKDGLICDDISQKKSGSKI